MQIFTTCPQCFVDLPDGGSSCTCGWKARAEPAPPVDPKKIEAERQEALAEANKQALEWCIAQGLNTREKQLEYIRSHLPKSLKALPLGSS